MEGASGARRDATVPLAGLASVAAIAFVAARAVPGFGFWIALAGGVPLARAAQHHGLRAGYATAGAGLCDSLAVMGPARFGVVAPQAASAPLLGALERRHAPLLWHVLATMAVRLTYNVAVTAFFIWVILGGLEAYAGTYDELARRLGLGPLGEGLVLALTAFSILVWSVFAGIVQSVVCRRGLRRWSEARALGEEPDHAPTAVAGRRFDPRAVVLAGALALVVLLTGTAVALLAAATAWLACAWLGARAEPGPLAGGLALAAPLVLGALAFGLLGGLGTEVALRRAWRAGLLVFVAVWVRAAASPEGLREVALRAVQALRRLPTAAATARVLASSDAATRLAGAGRRLGAELRGTHKRPRAVVDAVLAWVAAESASPRSGPGPRLALVSRLGDWVLVATATLPGLVALAL